MEFKLDKRDREEILCQIEKKALSYTPEWRFNREQPDLGSILALLYADLLEEGLSRYNQLPKFYKTAFFDMLGAEPRPAEASSGYMTFCLVDSDMPETVVPAKTRVEVKLSNDKKCFYETLEDLYVTGSHVEAVFTSNPNYEGQDKELREGWYLLFPKKPEKGLISLLFLIKNRGTSKEGSIVFEYFGSDGWKDIEAEDRTGGLDHTGTVLFAGTSGFEQKSFFGKTGYWIRMYAQGGQKLPEEPASVSVNATRVQACETGIGSNILPMQKHKLMGTCGFVSRIDNPDVLSGGSEAETEEEAQLLYGARLCHQFRAVTAHDFERLALEASGNISRVRCFGGYHENGRRVPGAVTVVVLQKDYEKGRPYFHEMKEKILAYLKERASPALTEGPGLFVTAPWFVRLDVQAVLSVSEHRNVLTVKEEAMRKLTACLNPVTGGAGRDGWEMGNLPCYDQLKQLLLGTEGAGYVKQLEIKAWLDRGNGYEETDLSWLYQNQLPWVLPLSGTHQLEIIVSK